MAILKRHKNSIYQLNQSLTNLSDDIQAQANTRATNLGDLSTLTSGSPDIVSAINNIVSETENTDAINLKIAANLSDVDDPAVARQSLNVYKNDDFLNQLEAHKLALGTNHTVANMTERDALTTVDEDDRVLVTDTGDGSWALYKPKTVDGTTGEISEWTLITNQGTLANTVTDADLRSYYLSNSDTNALSDTEEVKIGYLTVTKAIDLDNVALMANLSNNLETDSGTTLLSNVDAIKAYAEGIASISGFVPNHEHVTVVGDQIVLEHAPINGVNAILNYGNVRYIDANNVSYDAPVQATADPKTFKVLTETDTEWDGMQIYVQYLYYGTPGEVEGNSPTSDSSDLEGGSMGDPTIEDDGTADQGTLD